MTDLKCRRCDSDMSPGWLLENVTLGQRYNTTITEPVLWISGEAQPITDQWGSAEGAGFTVEGRDIMQTHAYRCTACGLLEMYAQPITEHYVRP